MLYASTLMNDKLQRTLLACECTFNIAQWYVHGLYSAHFNLLDYWIVLFCNFIQFIHLSRFLQTELWVQSTMQWCLSLWTGPVSSCLITTPYTSQSAPLSLGFPPFTYRIHQSLPVPLSLWWFLPFYIRLTVDCSAACFFNHNSIAIVIFFGALRFTLVIYCSPLYSFVWNISFSDSFFRLVCGVSLFFGGWVPGDLISEWSSSPLFSFSSLSSFLPPPPSSGEEDSHLPG